MTTEQDIQKQIAGDYQAFYSSIFDHELPPDLIERFKKALMALAPGIHQYHSDKMKILIAKRVDELSYLDVGMIINLISSVPNEKFYPAIDIALDENIKLEEIRMFYNKAVNEINIKLEKKQQRLLQLGGVTRSIPFNRVMAEA